MNETNTVKSEFLTVREAAGELNLSRVSVYKLVNGHEIAIHQFGKKTLISRTDLAAYKRRSRRPAQAPVMEAI
jgi:excisionase family DNA binding protein